MTTFLYNDGRRDDIRTSTLTQAAEAVIASLPTGPEKERAKHALQARRFEFRGKGEASQFFWAASAS